MLRSVSGVGRSRARSSWTLSAPIGAAGCSESSCAAGAVSTLVEYAAGEACLPSKLLERAHVFAKIPATGSSFEEERVRILSRSHFFAVSPRCRSPLCATQCAARALAVVALRLEGQPWKTHKAHQSSREMRGMSGRRSRAQGGQNMARSCFA